MRALIKKLILWALDGEFSKPAPTALKYDAAALDAIVRSVKAK